MEFKSSEDLREFILNRQDYDEEPQGSSGPCNEITWKKDHWVIKVDGKRAGEITSKDVPKNFNLREANFVMDLLKHLREGGLEAIKVYLKGMK